MSQKKDLFTRAIQIYQSKYKMNTKGLLKFINDKIDSPPQTIQLIQLQILHHQNGKDHFSQQELRGYLHVVAAIQANVQVKGKDISELKHYNKIKFKSRKAKEEKKEEEAKKVESQGKNEEKKEESKVEVKQKPIKKQTGQEQKQVELPPKPQKKAQKQKQKADHSSPFLKDKLQQQNLKPIEQNIAEEDRTSNVIRTSNSEQFFAKFPEAQLMKLRTTSQKQVQIRGYDKFGQNYFNPIIKYRVLFKEKSVYRRYTQFQNLMKYLNKRYEGFILPQLPPKQGIKSNLSYFRGVDEAFLNERQQKLEQMLNMLMNSKFISEDEVLINFLMDQDYEVESGQSEGTLNYIRSLGEIAFNTKELKTYGMAYYNYFKSFKKTDINTKVTQCYKNAQPVLSYCMQLQNYRTAIISNFDRRRQIFSQLEVDQNDRTLTITEFDKLSSASASEVKNLDKEMNKYYELKSQESWLGYLLSEKEAELDQGVEEVKLQRKEIKERIDRMELNLIESIDSLVRTKSLYLQEVGGLMVEWRRCIHP